MRVCSEKERPGYLLLLAVIANRLADGEKMMFIETLFECGAPMPRSSKGDPLLRELAIGEFGIISRNEFRYINQPRSIDRFTGVRTHFHGLIPLFLIGKIACLSQHFKFVISSDEERLSRGRHLY
jgi:hypothetical protein